MPKRARSIYGKIFLTIMLCFVVPMSIVFFGGYNKLEGVVMDAIEELTQSNIRQVEEELTDLNDRINQTSVYLSSDMRLNELLREYNNSIPANQQFLYHTGQPGFMDEYEYLKLSVELQNILINYADNWLSHSVEMGIVGNDGQLFTTWPEGNTDYEQLNKVVAAAKKEKNTYFTEIHPAMIKYGADSDYYTYVKVLYDIYEVDSELGILIVTVPVSAIEETVTQILDWEGQETYILDEEDTIIHAFSDEGKEINRNWIQKDMGATGQNIKNSEGEHFLIRMISAEGMKWQICCTIPYEQVFCEALELRRLVVSIGVTLMLMFAAVTLILIYHLLAPLRTLRDSMQRVENGDWNVQEIVTVSDDEIGMLASGFNRLVKELKLMFEREKESERQKGELRFEMLLAQINPHFLFNTLNSIKWMAAMVKADNIVSTIRSLARILEISMNRQADIITIQDELKNLESYLEIQSVRYGDLFSVEYNLEDGIKDYQTLKLVFQPIVENVVVHNIQEISPLNIYIEGKVQDDSIVFVVQDNGLGMDKEQVKFLLEKQENSGKKIFRGIGVRNVHQRIQLKYGEEYGVRIESEKGQGTKVEIRFPAVLNEAERGTLC